MTEGSAALQCDALQLAWPGASFAPRAVEVHGGTIVITIIYVTVIINGFDLFILYGSCY